MLVHKLGSLQLHSKLLLCTDHLQQILKVKVKVKVKTKVKVKDKTKVKLNFKVKVKVIVLVNIKFKVKVKFIVNGHVLQGQISNSRSNNKFMVKVRVGLS